LSRGFPDHGGLLSTKCGSPFYVAPEVITGHGYGAPVDVWSLGVVLYAMLRARLPFSETDHTLLLQQIMHDEPDFDFRMSNRCHDLLKRMFLKDPRERITLAEIKSHPFMSSSMYLSKELRDQINPDIGDHGEFCLNKTVIFEMESLGIDTSGLKEMIEGGVYNSVTATYRLLRKWSMDSEWASISTMPVSDMPIVRRKDRLAISYLVKPVVAQSGDASKRVVRRRVRNMSSTGSLQLQARSRSEVYQLEERMRPRPYLLMPRMGRMGHRLSDC
jgi:serine/threonine protein kinase